MTCSHDGTLVIWDPEERRRLLPPCDAGRPVAACDFSPDGRFILSIDGSGGLAVWDARSGNRIASKVALAREDCAWSPDGRWIATAGEFVFGGGEIQFWNAQPLELRTALRRDHRVVWEPGENRGKMVTGIEPGHSQSVSACAFSPNGRILVSASEDRALKLWDVERHQQIATLVGHEAEVTACCFAPDGHRLASGSADGTLRLWDVESATGGGVTSQHTEKVATLVYSRAAERFLSGSGDGSMKLWSGDGQVVATLPGHEGGPHAAVASATGRRVVSVAFGGVVGEVGLWDPVRADKVGIRAQRDWGTACALSPCGARVAVGWRNGVLTIYDCKRGAILSKRHGHDDIIESCAFSPSGFKILTGARDGTLRLWSPRTGKPLTLRFTERGGRVDSVKAHTAGVTACGYSPDERWIVSGDWNGKLKIWDAELNAEKHVLVGHSGPPVSACLFSPDGRRIASASWDGTVKLWNPGEGTPDGTLGTLKGHREGVSLAYSADGRRILSGSGDGTVRVWDAQTGDELGRAATEGGVRCLAEGRGGNTIAVGTVSGSVEVFRLTGFDVGPAVVTAVRLLRFAPLRLWHRLPMLRPMRELDYRLTAVCPSCGARSPVPAPVIDTIAATYARSGLDRKASPCIALDPQCWNEAGLLSQCPSCSESLRYNPFWVDRIWEARWTPADWAAMVDNFMLVELERRLPTLGRPLRRALCRYSRGVRWESW